MVSKSTMAVIMDVPAPVAAAAAKVAKANGARVLYSPGVRTQEGLSGLEVAIRVSDYLVVDTHELRNLTGSADEESSLEAVRNAFPALTIVATFGERGCVVSRGGVSSRVEGVELASLGKRAVNSTGSGDAFLGVFASYLLRGSSALEAAAWANLAGALKATRYETRGSPRLRELEDNMRRLERVRRTRLEFRGVTRLHRRNGTRLTR